MKPKELFKKIIKEDLAPLFKERGFKKKDTVFCRDLPEVVQIINLIPSRWNNQDIVSFSIDYAVFSKHYFTLLQRGEPRSWFNYQSYRPIIGGNINNLKSTKKYIPDYEILLNTNIQLVSQCVAEDLENYIFPYIESLNSNRELIKEIDRLVLEGKRNLVSEYDTILLYYSIGDKDMAQERLIHAWSLNINNDVYKPMLLDIAQKLGLDSSGLIT